MSRIAQNGRAGNSAPATHDHPGTPWRRHAEALADWTLARVVVRRDVYGTYYEAGGQFKQMTAHAPLTRNVLIRHYRGEATIGAHLISPDNLCTSVAADIDAHDDAADPDRNWRCALTTAEHLAGYALRPLVVDSNGKGGYHGLAFFKKPIPAAVAWWLGARLRDALEAAGFPPVEFFPKQGGVTLATPYGNWIRLPGKHHKRDHWSRIYDLEAGRWLEGEDAVQRLVAVAGDAPGRLLDAFRNAQANAAATTAPGGWTAAPPPKPRRGDREADAATVREALGFLPAAWADSYGGSRADTGWLGVGFALHDWDTGRGLDLWEEFSRRSPKYEPGACAAKWATFTAGRGLTLGTIFHVAEANGWTPPWRRPGKTPAANGRVPAPTPEPIDVAALLAKAKAFQKLSDLTSDRDYLDQLARLEVVDKEKANEVDVAAREALGGKKYIAKLVKIAMEGPRKAARRLASHPPKPRTTLPDQRDYGIGLQILHASHPPKPRTTLPDQRDYGIGLQILHASHPPKPRTTLPEILVDRPIHEVIADAVACLTTDPEVFRRGPNLVRMIRNENPPKGLQDTEGTPQIAVIPATRLIELLSRSALWVRERTNPEGDPILVATDPTATHASLVKDRCDWPGIRILDRVTEAPCLRPDGTLLQVPGYDPETGLFYLPESGMEFPEIPENPTPADARDAAKLLLDLVVDFPFEPSKEEGRESPHKYAWLASLLTMLCRSAIKGPCPLFLFTANTAGSGKTKLNDVNALIATGRRMPRSSYTENDEEVAKVLFSIALGGFPVVFFDNVGSGGALGGSAFDEALTSTSLNGRILGASEMREVPFYAVLFATGNNVRLKGDIHRRIVPCRLESPDEHPEQRDNFKLKEDLEEYTRKHRPAFVAAGLTIVRAYIVAGRPQQHLTPMDYPAWSGLIRNAVSWATGVDPCATREAIDDSDGDANELKRLVVAWEDLCNRENKDAISAADALKAIRPDPVTKCSRYDELFDLLTGMSKAGALPTSKVLGKILGKYRGRVVGTETGPKSLREITLHGNMLWFVRPAQGGSGGSQGGSGGSGGSNSGYPVTKTDFSLPRQVSETEEKKGEKKIDFHGHQPEFDPPDPPDPPGIDSDGEADTAPPCGGCWRMDCPWCTPADDNASEGGAR